MAKKKLVWRKMRKKMTPYMLDRIDVILVKPNLLQTVLG